MSTSPRRCEKCGGGDFRVERRSRLYDPDLEVTAEGVEHEICERCGAVVSFVWERSGELKKLILQGLARKGWRLSPGEIRFIRKRLGVSPARASEILGVAEDELVAWENGVRQPPPLGERALRLLVVTGGFAPLLEVDDLSRIALDHAAPLAMSFELTPIGWQLVSFRPTRAASA